MPKPLKIILVVVAVAIVWGSLASIDAGPAGLGVVLSLLALLDVGVSEFKGNNKVIWLIVCLAALFFATIAIGSVMMVEPDATGKQPLYVMGTVVTLILPVIYFLVGRGQRVLDREKR